MLKVIDKFTPVRVSEADEAHLDDALHGEEAYDFSGNPTSQLPIPGAAE
jgi:ammonia channel protein AmtB